MRVSLSEYGCIKAQRKFDEVKSLYSSDMTSVYSGGLVYEFTEEGSKYGLVKMDGDHVNELDDFAALKSALAGTPAPSGDGGYKSSGSASECPSKSNTWNVTISADELPSVPSGVDLFMKSGAGNGPGLTGPGSQSAGSKTGSVAPAESGAVQSSAPAGQSATPSKGAAPSTHIGESSMAPLACGLVLLVSTIFGASLI
jgi:hypothetical protein